MKSSVLCFAVSRTPLRLREREINKRSAFCLVDFQTLSSRNRRVAKYFASSFTFHFTLAINRSSNSYLIISYRGRCRALSTTHQRVRGRGKQVLPFFQLEWIGSTAQETEPTFPFLLPCMSRSRIWSVRVREEGGTVM